MDWHYALPLVTLIASEAVAFVMKGPGALGFSVPAMIWYAMAYGVRPTVLLNFVLSLWKMLSISIGSFTFSLADINDVTSLRLGVALLSLAPLTVACTYALRQQSLGQLRQLVDYDALTGALSRRALLERGGKLLQRMRGEGQPMVLLMIDLDYFKQVNDLYGHANGDKVLQAFVRSTQAVLRPEDVLGRMGGEEFVVILPRTALAQAQRVAQRIGDQLRQLEIVLEGNNVIGVTCSIGVAAITQWRRAQPAGVAPELCRSRPLPGQGRWPRLRAAVPRPGPLTTGHPGRPLPRPGELALGMPSPVGCIKRVFWCCGPWWRWILQRVL